MHDFYEKAFFCLKLFSGQFRKKVPQSRWESASSASFEPKTSFLAQLVSKIGPNWKFFYHLADVHGH